MTQSFYDFSTSIKKYFMELFEFLKLLFHKNFNSFSLFGILLYPLMKIKPLLMPFILLLKNYMLHTGFILSIILIGKKERSLSKPKIISKVLIGPFQSDKFLQFNMDSIIFFTENR